MIQPSEEVDCSQFRYATPDVVKEFERDGRVDEKHTYNPLEPMLIPQDQYMFFVENLAPHSDHFKFLTNGDDEEDERAETEWAEIEAQENFEAIHLDWWNQSVKWEEEIEKASTRAVEKFKALCEAGAFDGNRIIR